MSAAEDTGAPRPTGSIVDVLIVGSGASGAAVAWSLAETRMKILCLEQGGWLKPTELPTTGPDWEARRYADFHISPNRRARDTDYPINDTNSVMKVANFNGVGGGTILYMAHFPRTNPLCPQYLLVGPAPDTRGRSTNSAGTGGRPISRWRLRSTTVAPSASI